MWQGSGHVIIRGRYVRAAHKRAGLTRTSAHTAKGYFKKPSFVKICPQKIRQLFYTFYFSATVFDAMLTLLVDKLHISAKNYIEIPSHVEISEKK